jgi:sugar lactone lactonase YvrE
LRNLLILMIVAAIAGAITLRVRYGGGVAYVDINTEPLLPETDLETYLDYPEPIGNVAVNASGRVFFTVHPESRPRGNRLLEWVDGAAVPYPSGALQPDLFDTVLGVVVDRQNRLWTIDSGNHGLRDARLLGFDLHSDELVHDHTLPPEIAPAGSFLQDLQVSADGQTIVIADASIWRKSPALIVYDVASRRARRVLEHHESVTAEDYLIRTPTRDMRFIGGLVDLQTGVDGIAFDSENEWLYYGAVNQSGLFRVRLADLRDDTLPARQLGNRVERYSDKPLSDGLSADVDGNIYVTDVEHGSVLKVGPDGSVVTVVRSPRIRWADALSFGPDGWLYLADSAIPELVLKPREHVRSQAPYFIFRFRPGHSGVPGQ